MSSSDDNVAIIGDWLPPNPSPRTFFSAMLGDENHSRFNSIPEPLVRNEAEGFFSGPKDNWKDTNSLENFAESGPFSVELRSGSRGGLMDRIAARAGFNAPKLNTEGIRPNDVLNPEARSHFLMLSPGLSPTTLLESPVFLSNSLAQPSPTTGKVPFVPNSSVGNSRLVPRGPDRSKDNNLFEDSDSSSFAFKPGNELTPSFFSSELKQSFPRMDGSVSKSDAFLESHNAEYPKLHLEIAGNNNKNNNNNDTVQSDQSSPFEELQEEEGDQKGNNADTAPSEDRYSWRKYGQKQVKGSEYPRSYYKCTHPNCQVKKKVERSHEGHITEIIYKGAHNHPKPQVNHRGVEPEQGWGDSVIMKSSGSEWRQENNLEVKSSPPSDGCNTNNTGPEAQFEQGNDAVDASSTFSNEECEDNRANGGALLGREAEEDESESKRRKIELYPMDMTGATRAIREPRVVVQTTSEVDILDDGYRWRKYGQKVVKGNPNPRSYYKCTSTGCTVRKHVERASHDLKSVITTYEGKHNHDVPAARNSSHGSNSGPGPAQPISSCGLARGPRPEQSRAQNGFPRFDGPGALGSFGMPGRPQMAHNGFSFGMNASNLGMAGFGKMPMPMMPLHPFLAAQQQQHQQGRVNEMGFVMQKGEMKPEPGSDTGLNLSNN